MCGWGGGGQRGTQLLGVYVSTQRLVGGWWATVMWFSFTGGWVVKFMWWDSAAVGCYQGRVRGWVGLGMVGVGMVLGSVAVHCWLGVESHSATRAVRCEGPTNCSRVTHGPRFGVGWPHCLLRVEHCCANEWGKRGAVGAACAHTRMPISACNDGSF